MHACGRSALAPMWSPTGLCTKVEGLKPLGVWHNAQLVLSPAWVLGGVWHDWHNGDVPAYTPDLWQDAQGTDWCCPVSGNLVWLNVAGFQPLGLWHCTQPDVMPGMCPLGVLWQDSQVEGRPA